jgi:hypothetical protein
MRHRQLKFDTKFDFQTTISIHTIVSGLIFLFLKGSGTGIKMVINILSEFGTRSSRSVLIRISNSDKLILALSDMIVNNR